MSLPPRERELKLPVGTQGMAQARRSLHGSVN